MILIVDDDEAVRDSLSVMLSLAGFDVFTFKSCAELLTLLADKTPDCLVVDVHMPEMNGLELVARLNAMGVAVPVVLISGNMDTATEAQARALDVMHILRKPFPGAVLIDTVKGITG